MVCPMVETDGTAGTGESVCVLPGGNSGEYFSEYYDDQLKLWVDGKYKSMRREIVGETAIRFEQGERDPQEGDR